MPFSCRAGPHVKLPSKLCHRICHRCCHRFCHKHHLQQFTCTLSVARLAQNDFDHQVLTGLTSSTVEVRWKSITSATFSTWALKNNELLAARFTQVQVALQVSPQASNFNSSHALLQHCFNYFLRLGHGEVLVAVSSAQTDIDLQSHRIFTMFEQK